MRVLKRETYRRVQTFESDLTSFSPFQIQSVEGEGGAFKIYLPSVYPAAIVPYSDVVVVVVVVGILPSRETMVCALCDFGLISLVESSDGCDSAARSLHGSLYRSCRTRSLTVGLVLGSAASLSSLLSSP